MAYCTQTDVQNAAGGANRLVQICDPNHNGEVDTTYLAAKIAEADAWIDMYLRARISTPVASPVPESLKRLSAAETVYLLKRNGAGPSERDAIEHEERLMLLRDLSTGKARIEEPMPNKSTSVAAQVFERSSDEAISREALDENW